ncbi:MAG: dihydrofolate reductase [Saezia sp.]
MSINLIFARSINGVIGRDNNMPWHLPEDLAHFRECTQGSPVIMGRKTWESLPTKFRPLPDRTNIVVTRSESWGEEGAIHALNIKDALEKAKSSGAENIWVIGGAQIYEAALPHATRAYVTLIKETYEGDAYAPELPEEEWEVIESTDLQKSAMGLKYRFMIYQRKG